MALRILCGCGNIAEFGCLCNNTYHLCCVSCVNDRYVCKIHGVKVHRHIKSLVDSFADNVKKLPELNCPMGCFLDSVCSAEIHMAQCVRIENRKKSRVSEPFYN